jgi:hypothetical protein
MAAIDPRTWFVAFAFLVAPMLSRADVVTDWNK